MDEEIDGANFRKDIFLGLKDCLAKMQPNSNHDRLGKNDFMGIYVSQGWSWAAFQGWRWAPM